jgi:quercetin dioxygenase-like cupin family protein
MKCVMLMFDSLNRHMLPPYGGGGAPPVHAPNFAMRRFTMGEGGGMPRHTNLVEHEQYVVRGRARVTVGDTVHEVGEGDVLLIPGGTPHSYDVEQAPFEFLCMVPNREDRIDLC